MSGETRLGKLLLEGGAVVASILLAFAIDAGWDSRQERQAERLALAALDVELEANRATMEQILEANESAQLAGARFLRMSPDEVREADPGDLWHIVVSLWAPQTFDPQVGALEAFLERPISSEPAIAEVRRAVSDWRRLLEEADEEGIVLWQASREALGELARFVADMTPEEGGEPRMTMIRQDLAPRLLLIRDDEEAMAAAIAKFNLQRLYASELGTLHRHTEALLSRLDELR